MDWGVFHEHFIDEPMLPLEEDRQWFLGPRLEYLQWYQRRGMPTVWIQAVTDQALEEVLPDPPQTQIASLPYQSRGNRHARCVCI